MASLLHLPTELLTSILQFVATSPEPLEQIRDLISIAQTCSSLHHAIFCTTNDFIWRSPAIALGIPRTTALEDILCPGSSALQKRKWLNVVKLNHAWSQEFPVKMQTLPRNQRASSMLPPQSKNGDWLGRRTIEMCASGSGSRTRPVYRAKNTAPGHQGLAFFSTGHMESLGTGGVLDPLRVEWTYTYARPKSSERREDFRVPGYVIQEKDNMYTICELGVEPKKGLRSWDLGEREIHTFVTNGDTLVALTYRTSPAPPIRHASNLICVTAVDFDKNAESRVIWECDIYTDWVDDVDSYTRFARVKDFRMTSTHLVCLVSRHNDPYLQKLTRVEFLVLDLHTAELKKAMRFKREPLSSNRGIRRRAALTTAFDHDFLLTDKFCVSGGPGGELLVWDYLKPKGARLLYSIPVWCSGGSKENEFLRTFSSLTMSADGRYIGTTTSDQLFIVDMVKKTVHARYNNGRHINEKDLYLKNPGDDFPGGIWCWWKEWKCRADQDTGEVVWEEADPTGGGVAYLTDVVAGDAQRAHASLRMVPDMARKRPSLWECSGFILLAAVCYGCGESACAAVAVAAFAVRYLLSVSAG